LYRQGVHVGSKANGTTHAAVVVRPAMNYADNSSAPNACHDVIQAEAAQLVGDEGSSASFCEGKLWMAMEVSPPCRHVILKF
jgi:hypothetical protein